MGRRFFIAKIICFCAAVTLMLACNGQQVEASSEKSGNDTYVLLGLLGYNYTNRDIDSYTVDGAGGGGVMLSSSASGGSGVTCCVKLPRAYAGPIRVTIRWQVDGCKYLIKDDRTGEADSVRHFYYKEAEVNVRREAGTKPKYIETHFYPDGTVQVQLVEHRSKSRLLLDGNRPDKSTFPRCKDDKKPEE
jgi:hypothetical protein